MRELFPIPRSLTGDGVRRTLDILGRQLSLELVEMPTGTQVFDWSLPKEWNIRDAWIEAPNGRRVVDLADSTLHVLGYSTPVEATVTLEELREHVFTHPTNPDVVPYRTSYYEERWGFCMSQRALDRLGPGSYRVYIDSSLSEGHVTYGEVVIPGETGEQVLLTTNVCHPALANDNLSGVVLLAALGKALHHRSLRFTYRLLWSPGTIGPLCWLWRNQSSLSTVRHGLAISCVGDPGPITYKQSRWGNAEIDRAAGNVLRRAGEGVRVLDWFPYGGDERQFCSPGFDLPVGALARTPADQFPEYHSSADNLDFVRAETLESSLQTVLDIVDVIDTNVVYRNLAPYGEPQLGKRGLFRAVGGASSSELALLWVLSLADGETSLLDISDRSRFAYSEIRRAAGELLDVGLLEPVG